MKYCKIVAFVAFFIINQPTSGENLLSKPNVIHRGDIKVLLKTNLTLNCHALPANASNTEDVVWVTNVGSVITLNTSKLSVPDDQDLDRLEPQPSGSLTIYNVTRSDAGTYMCLYGNHTAVTVVTLDYSVVTMVEVYSFLVGFLSAIGFFLIAVVLSVIRYFAHMCSKEERAKRRSFREVLSVLRSSSHMDRLSAYRTAKLDQFSTFRSATKDQFAAFRTTKVGKLRTYKQSTVLSMQQYLERMREYYSVQTDRLKQNCATRNQRLRRSYTAQRRRLGGGQRSAPMRNIRQNYQVRRMKIRSYGASQMNRLREQYKSQQQHVLKLLELLDIGNCVNIIRDDCQRTESAIFDHIEFDDVGTSPPNNSVDKLDEEDEDDDDDDELCSGGTCDLGGDGDITPLEADSQDEGAEEDFDFEEEGGYNVTMDDVLGDIAARVDLIHSESVGGSLYTGELEASSSSGKMRPRAKEPRARVVSLTVSLRDLHDDKSRDQSHFTAEFNDPFDSDMQLASDEAHSNGDCSASARPRGVCKGKCPSKGKPSFGCKPSEKVWAKPQLLEGGDGKRDEFTSDDSFDYCDPDESRIERTARLVEEKRKKEAEENKNREEEPKETSALMETVF